MTRKNAFTLAEVLITLGIIGVVAAMTMPTLMNSTQGAQYKTAYKKALSAISQAIVLNVALDDYNLADTSTTATGTTGTQNMYSLFKNRMNVVKTSQTTTGYAITERGAVFGQGSTNYTMFFNDGIAFSFPIATGECSESAVRAPGATKCRWLY